jgi:hypothetical protein
MFRLLILNASDLLPGDKALVMAVAKEKGKFVQTPCKLQMEIADESKNPVWVDVPFERLASVVALDLRDLSFAQTDVTKSSGDNRSPGPNDWIETTPINASVPEAQRPRGLPALDATEDQIYEIAERGSRLRESLRRSDQLSSDGVYCPICHIANTQLSLLRKPCPRCGRELLLFDWT